jgi:hypothetical protein
MHPAVLRSVQGSNVQPDRMACSCFVVGQSLRWKFGPTTLTNLIGDQIGEGQTGISLRSFDQQKRQQQLQGTPSHLTFSGPDEVTKMGRVFRLKNRQRTTERTTGKIPNSRNSLGQADPHRIVDRAMGIAHPLRPLMSADGDISVGIDGPCKISQNGVLHGPIIALGILCYVTRDRRREVWVMFGRSNQYATVIGFGVRVKDEREQDRNHLIESTFTIPLTHELADEILPAMARDLFQEVGGDWVPKPEMTEAVFGLAPDLQLMTVRQHPDLDPVFTVAGVTVRKIRAKKTEANTWDLQFTVTWQLGSDTEAISMIRALKSGVYLTFEVQQPTLVEEPVAITDEDEPTAPSKVANITDGKKKRGRRKKNPEAEKQEQAAHAAAVGDQAAD